jgi:hypothetical protein
LASICETERASAQQMCRYYPSTEAARVVQMQGITGYGEEAILYVCDPNHIQ